MPRLRLNAIAATILAVMGALWIVGGPSPASAQGGFDWKRYSGKQIRFS